MANIVNNCKNISIVEGNDTVLKLWLYTRELQNNATVRVPFNFDDGDKVEVRLCRQFKTEKLQSERDGTEDNCLIVLLPWTVAAKCYGLEVKVERDGKHLRSFDCGRINIVECNAEASPTLERINTAWQAGMEVDMQIAFSAVTHGENAYELWRRQPGNENKTLQDFIDEVLNLNQNAAAARQASQDANAAAELANKKAQAAEMAAANAKAKAAFADQKATLADTAAQNANAAAEKIQTASFAVDAEMNLILLKNEQSTLTLEVTNGVLYEIKEQ